MINKKNSNKNAWTKYSEKKKKRQMGCVFKIIFSKKKPGAVIWLLVLNRK